VTFADKLFRPVAGERISIDYQMVDPVASRSSNIEFIALPGLSSVLLTGGIGLLQLDPQWLAIKDSRNPRTHRHSGAALHAHSLSADKNPAL
jgi:hypothetical protein